MYFILAPSTAAECDMKSTYSGMICTILRIVAMILSVLNASLKLVTLLVLM